MSSSIHGSVTACKMISYSLISWIFPSYICLGDLEFLDESHIFPRLDYLWCGARSVARVEGAAIQGLGDVWRISPKKKLGQVLVQPLGIQLIQKTFEEAFHFETLHGFFFKSMHLLLVADLQLDVLKFNRWRSSSGHCEATSLASYLMDWVGFSG